MLDWLRYFNKYSFKVYTDFQRYSVSFKEYDARRQGTMLMQ